MALRTRAPDTTLNLPERPTHEAPNSCGTPPSPPGPPATSSDNRSDETFTALELKTIELARSDDVRSAFAPGPIRRLAGLLFGWRELNSLANPRLEALRRVALLAWRDGYRIDPNAMADLLEAGFEIRHFELLLQLTASARPVSNLDQSR